MSLFLGSPVTPTPLVQSITTKHSRRRYPLLACAAAALLIGCGELSDDNGGYAALVVNSTSGSSTAGSELSTQDSASAPKSEPVPAASGSIETDAAQATNTTVTSPAVREAESSTVAANGSSQPATVPTMQDSTQTDLTSPGTTNTGTTNSVQIMIDDMQLMNDAVLVGINPNYGFAKGPGYVIMGNIPRSANLPDWYAAQYPQMTVEDWWNYILPWFVLFEGEGNQSDQTRVQMRNLKLYVLSRTTNEWNLVSSAQNVGGELCPAGSNMHQCSGGNNKRIEASGGVSFLPVPGTAFHGWFGSKQQIEAWDVKAVHVTMQARLIGEDANDMASARFLFDVGADYYPSEGPSPIFLPGVGVSRAKLISPQWQSFNFTSLSDVGKQEPGGGITAAELRQNPPPMD